MKQYALLAIFVAALFNPYAAADWYETTGQAVIEQGNIEQARQAAIDDAIKRAALFAGASLSSTQQLVNGVLQQERLGFISNGEISQLQLLTEQHENNMLTITLRLYIEAQSDNCSNNSFSKPVLLPQLQLKARQDAVHGDLFKLGEHATTQLERHLRDYSPAATLQLLAQPVLPSALVYPTTEQLFNQGHQYIISAQINDMSLGQASGGFWQQKVKERHFSIEVALFDLFEQTTVYQQEYRTSAPWPYQEQSTPSSHSQAFWNMAYGQKIDQLLQIIAEDIQRQLACKPLLSSVLQVKGSRIMLNLGKQHGLHMGDSLELFQLQRQPTTPAVKHLLNSQLKLTVSSVSERNAWATADDGKFLQHIQSGDIISVRKNSEQ
ncbi:flagellar assembly protein T N-terminal domain-containing protein [Rheinheimera maricola]|uniref:Flagellar assembly protein FlgT n=1 Tax=Rheinheimera maricola TaxID=2793282 RepID=A0ABS7X6D5_9GAMM|nr:flagellar assembly protein T N-terminal domain-containing protein [Rheinheimera maricola]MBZ9610187.1 flagellar assembly protein FlgT [Rheinheimera maricola]